MPFPTMRRKRRYARAMGNLLRNAYSTRKGLVLTGNFWQSMAHAFGSKLLLTARSRRTLRANRFRRLKRFVTISKRCATPELIRCGFTVRLRIVLLMRLHDWVFI